MAFDVEEFLAHRGDTPIGDVLIHYASEYYDPAKAHEYYLKNRELKGRQSTKGMSETQRNAWSYTKNQIGERRKAELKSKAEEQKARLEELRNKAEETRTRLQEKLKGLLDSLKVGQTPKVEAEVIPVPDLIPIPENASPKVRQYLQGQNARRINKYNGEVQKAEKVAREKQKAVNEEYALKREAAAKSSEEARAQSREERIKIGNELKTAVADARNAYESAKKQIVDKYEAAKETEYQNIKTQLPGAAPKAKKAPKPKKAPAAKKPRKKKQTTETEGELQNGS
jgi:hypothetical protein